MTGPERSRRGRGLLVAAALTTSLPVLATTLLGGFDEEAVGRPAARAQSHAVEHTMEPALGAPTGTLETAPAASGSPAARTAPAPRPAREARPRQPATSKPRARPRPTPRPTKRRPGAGMPGRYAGHVTPGRRCPGWGWWGTAGGRPAICLPAGDGSFRWTVGGRGW